MSERSSDSKICCYRRRSYLRSCCSMRLTNRSVMVLAVQKLAREWAERRLVRERIESLSWIKDKKVLGGRVCVPALDAGRSRWTRLARFSRALSLVLLEAERSDWSDGMDDCVRLLFSSRSCKQAERAEMAGVCTWARRTRARRPTRRSGTGRISQIWWSRWRVGGRSHFW